MRSSRRAAGERPLPALCEPRANDTMMVQQLVLLHFRSIHFMSCLRPVRAGSTRRRGHAACRKATLPLPCTRSRPTLPGRTDAVTRRYGRHEPDFRAPHLPSRPPGQRGPHAQTLCARVLRAADDPGMVRERWDTPDGDFLDVDWVPHPGPGRARPPWRWSARPRGLVPPALRARDLPRPPRGRRPPGGHELPRVRRRSPTACPASTTRERRGTSPSSSSGSAPSTPGRRAGRLRLLPRRERPPQDAGRARRRRERPGGRRRRHVGALRPGRRRPLAGADAHGALLHRLLPPLPAREGAGQGAAARAAHRRGRAALTRPHDPRLRRRGHGAAARLPGRGHYYAAAAAPVPRAGSGCPRWSSTAWTTPSSPPRPSPGPPSRPTPRCTRS